MLYVLCGCAPLPHDLVPDLLITRHTFVGRWGDFRGGWNIMGKWGLLNPGGVAVEGLVILQIDGGMY